MQMKIDILGVNSTDVVLVECKSRLSQGDVEEFLSILPASTWLLGLHAITPLGKGGVITSHFIRVESAIGIILGL